MERLIPLVLHWVGQIENGGWRCRFFQRHNSAFNWHCSILLLSDPNYIIPPVRTRYWLALLLHQQFPLSSSLGIFLLISLPDKVFLKGFQTLSGWMICVFSRPVWVLWSKYTWRGAWIWSWRSHHRQSLKCWTLNWVSHTTTPWKHGTGIINEAKIIAFLIPRPKNFFSRQLPKDMLSIIKWS